MYVYIYVYVYVYEYMYIHIDDVFIKQLVSRIFYYILLQYGSLLIMHMQSDSHQKGFQTYAVEIMWEERSSF